MSEPITNSKKKSKQNKKKSVQLNSVQQNSTSTDDNIVYDTKKNKEMTAYIIVNESLGMSKGKIASQSAHAILDVHRFLLRNNIEHSRWTSYGEKIVVVKASESQLKLFLSSYENKIPDINKFNLFPIYDAGKTEVESGSLTVIASTPITDDVKPDFIRELKLL